MKKRILTTFFGCLFIIGMIVNIQTTKLSIKENNLILTNLFQFSEANAEITVNTKCYDVPNCGSGPFYNRVCVKNQMAYCQKDFYDRSVLPNGNCSQSN